MKKNALSELFLTFMKIGLFTFGGGYAMLSMMEHSCVEEKLWITHDDMMDITVIAESTPGPIAINCATFVGYRQAGLPGAVAATFGIVLPSFVTIYAISIWLDNFLEIAVISKAFKGIKVAVGLLILNAALTMVRKMNKKAFPLTIMSCAFGATLMIDIFDWRISSVALMLLCAVGSLAVFLMESALKRKGGGAE